MRWYLLLALLASLSFVVADTQFDICGFEDAFPEFYYDYGIKECPPVFYLTNNGKGPDCQEFELDKKTYASFCQLNTRFYYGQERPFARIPVCRGPMTCRITESVHEAYGWKAKVNGNFKKDALTMGITGGYNDKSGYAQSYSFTKILDEDTCGYWTFVPYVRQSCGTYTTAAKINGKPDLPWQTTVNACADQPVGLNSGDKLPDIRTIRGSLIFVWVDCLTLLPLPDEKQDIVYRQDGVKLPRHFYDAYVDLWNAQLGKDNAHIVEADDAKCDSKTQANADDCADAISMLLDDPGKDINYYESLATSGDCAINIEVDSAWADAPCLGTYLDAALAAQTIFDACTTVNGGGVGGSLSMGGKAGCYKVKFGKA